MLLQKILAVFHCKVCEVVGEKVLMRAYGKLLAPDACIKLRELL